MLTASVGIVVDVTDKQLIHNNMEILRSTRSIHDTLACLSSPKEGNTLYEISWH